MRSLKHTTAFAVLRIGIVICLVIIFVAAISVVALQGTIVPTRVTTTARDGVLDLRGEQSPNGILSLSGVWEYYPRVFSTGEHFDARLLDGTPYESVNMPLNDVKRALGPGTYRLTLKTDQPLYDYAFYLEHCDEDFAVYVNGVRINPINRDTSTLLYAMSNYLFRMEEPIPAGENELLISANSTRTQSLLYRKAVLFGPEDQVIDDMAYVWRDNTFLIGMILVMVAMGLVFALIRTKFDMLTSITLFDTLLAARILLGYNDATYFVHRLLPGLALGNVDFVGLQYVAFFLAGAFGCLLSQSIFDSKLQFPSWPIKVQIAVCAFGGIFTLFCFKYASKLCVSLLFITLVGSFLIVTAHIVQLIRQKRLNGYYLFQIIKTYYVGGIMALDILYCWGSSTYNLLVYAYIGFLLAHLAARLIDSNANYREVELLNRNLEQIIASRTSELTETNHRLSELSVRDPLTQAHNRLFFEEKMAQALRSGAGVPVYLCMFDLDFFKRINDRFGHASGDEQLTFVVNETNRILNERGTLSRIGGEEFAILFEGEQKNEVLELVEQIRRRLEEDSHQNEKRTTASFGLVRCREGVSSKEIMRAADNCLYSAKKMGRNCIVMR